MKTCHFSLSLASSCFFCSLASLKHPHPGAPARPPLAAAQPKGSPDTSKCGSQAANPALSNTISLERLTYLSQKQETPFLSRTWELLDAKSQQKPVWHAPFSCPSRVGVWSWGKGGRETPTGWQRPPGTQQSLTEVPTGQREEWGTGSKEKENTLPQRRVHGGGVLQAVDR